VITLKNELLTRKRKKEKSPLLLPKDKEGERSLEFGLNKALRGGSNPRDTENTADGNRWGPTFEHHPGYISKAFGGGKQKVALDLTHEIRGRSSVLAKGPGKKWEGRG